MLVAVALEHCSAKNTHCKIIDRLLPCLPNNVAPVARWDLIVLVVENGSKLSCAKIALVNAPLQLFWLVRVQLVFGSDLEAVMQSTLLAIWQNLQCFWVLKLQHFVEHVVNWKGK